MAHWITRKDSGGEVIISFDFRQDKLRTTKLPPDLMADDSNGLSVCKWQGLLSVTHYDNDLSDECKLWAL